ncbi:MAG: SDR family oxidoreductase [Alphaproteobacteria bacterium]|jgi:NAD(P)-dependent dehydrogenase (short-subunit alcohol dehydrogenase family)
MNFAGRAAIVFGAGGGMGLTIANDLISGGADVTLADLKPRPDDVAEGPGSAAYHQGDASDEAFVAEVVAKAVADSGRLDYLVNTTGVLWFDRDTSLVDMDMEVWDRVFDINLKSHALTARHAIPEMKKTGGGAMVHISSIDALRGDDKPQDAYGASKAGLLRLSKSIAIQFAADGIRSNTILPGAVLTPMQARWDGNDDVLTAVASSVPLGRIGTPRDIANACLFLLSDQASYITGTEMVVDGGVLAKP